MPSRRFGHLGPMCSPPSRVETVPSLKPSRALWMAPALCLTPWLPRGMPPRPCNLQVSRPPREMLCFRRCSPVAEDDPADLTRRWQRPASCSVNEFYLRAIRRELDAPGLALLDSQSCPHAACVFTTRPVSPELSFSSPLYRVLLLRRLRLPLPLTSARCRCRQLHDRFGGPLRCMFSVRRPPCQGWASRACGRPRLPKGRSHGCPQRPASGSQC